MNIGHSQVFIIKAEWACDWCGGANVFPSVRMIVRYIATAGRYVATPTATAAVLKGDIVLTGALFRRICRHAVSRQTVH